MRMKDNDYYSTNELDKNQYSYILEKVSNERNIYKETINIMCDKFNIEQDEVLNIIDDISLNKSKENERV